ncbi:MAG TPA: TetR/AcrR family transcriptional regulator [Phenylobacterium sp.]|nr:TetR/AcrR family transcriptional regulator [Phenylobacterium sp.]
MEHGLTFHERHKLATREAILDAVERRLQDGGLDELTFMQVAQEAGVSDRTVYRHFPTKDALLEAFWRRVQQSLGIATSTRSWADYLATRPAAFAEMDRREAVLRAVMNSSQAHEARLRLNAERQAGIRRVVAEAVGELPEPQFTELCALVHLLGSAPAWQALKDYWGIEGDAAGRVVAQAVATLADAARRTPEPSCKPSNPGAQK